MKEPFLRCCAAIVAIVQILAATALRPTQDVMDLAAAIFLVASTTVFITFAIYGSKAAERILNRLLGQSTRVRKPHTPLRNDE